MLLEGVIAMIAGGSARADAIKRRAVPVNAVQSSSRLG